MDTGEIFELWIPAVGTSVRLVHGLVVYVVHSRLHGLAVAQNTRRPSNGKYWTTFVLLTLIGIRGSIYHYRQCPGPAKDLAHLCYIVRGQICCDYSLLLLARIKLLPAQVWHKWDKSTFYCANILQIGDEAIESVPRGVWSSGTVKNMEIVHFVVR